MSKVSDIKAVIIRLETADRQALFILLAADGSINRQGTGSVDNEDNDLFIGITQEPFFDQLMTKLDDDMLAIWAGTMFQNSAVFHADYR